MERATFAAGSFERVEETFRRIEGVQQTMVGYAGGSAPDPSYFDVCTGTTGHAEVAEIYFDPSQISYEQLLNVFWDAHDPTSFQSARVRCGQSVPLRDFSSIRLNRKLRRTPRKSGSDRAGFTRPIVTEIVPVTGFYRAEKYHQRHIARQGDPVSRG
jgi:peptide-methionine (S)-S-oxide reductase